MKATGTLPTEERVQRMNDQQWLWFYFNLRKDEEEDDKKWKERLDYSGWYTNPNLARSVMMQELVKDNPEAVKQMNMENGEYEDIKDTVNNDTFEDEFKRALAQDGLSEDAFTELPDSMNAGNPNESKTDFLNRVMANQELMNQNIIVDELPPGINPDDIDYFELN